MSIPALPAPRVEVQSHRRPTNASTDDRLVHKVCLSTMDGMFPPLPEYAPVSAAPMQALMAMRGSLVHALCRPVCHHSGVIRSTSVHVSSDVPFASRLSVAPHLPGANVYKCPGMRDSACARGHTASSEPLCISILCNIPSPISSGTHSRLPYCSVHPAHVRQTPTLHGVVSNSALIMLFAAVSMYLFVRGRVRLCAACLPS